MGLKAEHYDTTPAVLIATLGTEPQVVTSALDLLLARDRSISRVSILHTSAPGTLIAEAVEQLGAIFKEGHYRGKVDLELRPICGSDNEPLEDVETEQATQVAFKVLYGTVRSAKREGYRVHLSIAGGRKTISVFGMVTAQLLFDEKDHLWHLYSAGDFLESKRLHPTPEDDVHLIPIPVIHWSKVAPILMDFATIEDPIEALKRQQELQLVDRLDDARAFVRGALSPAEERAVSLLVKEGLSDSEIGQRLVLSPRTVEQHLRSAYAKAAAHWELPSVSRAQLTSLLNIFYLLEGG